MLASIIMPGLGQIFSGFRALGRLMMGGALGFLAVGVFYFIRGYIAYMDIVLEMDVQGQLPNIWDSMHITTIIACFSLALIIHASSIIHMLYYTSKQKDKEQ